MGLRYASVRQPNVVVMAPALTETGQPQGFPAKPGSLSSPVSLITFNEKAEGDLKYEIKCATRLNLVNSTSVMNGGSDNVTELQTVLTSTESSLNEKRKDILSNNCEVLDQNTPKESDYSLLQIGGFMMNNSFPGAGDEDNMGFQKTGSNVDSCNYLKMDNLFKGLGPNPLSQSDLGGGGDLGHNVDEIMQVIKNMESKGNDIEENLDSTLQINDSNDIAGSLSTFDREFFNDVVMMNMCVDENLGENPLAVVNRDTVIKDKIDEAADKQFQIERKCEWLLRRLHKMQARAMGKHCSEEISGMLQYVSDVVEDSTTGSSKLSTLYSALTLGKEDCEKMSKITPKPNSNVAAFMKKLQQSSHQQALAMSQHNVPCKYFGSGSYENSSAAVSRQGTGPSTLSASLVPKLDSEVRKEIDNVSGQLHHQLRVVEHGIDPDVTASSSGGESCDEFQCYNNSQQHSLTISKRASWRWAQDRTAIGSRWAWLQGQISDLEYRIRQNNDLHKQIRTAKGSVSLGGDDPPRLCDSVVVNGYHGALPGSTGKSVDEETVSESACRTRPLLRSSFRKRKLFQTAGLHLTSKKAAKPSSVPCGCSPPLPSCALCTGRPDPKQPYQDLDLFTLNERIALLDPAFHPILSCPNDVSQSLHFDAIMKTPDWQMKCHRLQLKTTPLMRVLEQTEEVPQPVVESIPKQRPLVEQQQRRRYFRRSTATTLSEKIKRKLTKGKRPKMIGDQNKYALEKLKTRRRFSSLEVPGMSGEERGQETGPEEDESQEATSPMAIHSGATHPSPVPSPTPTPHCSKEAFRRKRENSYDIDNIVIPYSVAAATRLEKLQYKEILTPKWRVLPVEPLPKPETKNNNGLIRRLSQDNGELEDLTEEMLVSRHDRCEVEEKKKFLSYLKLPNSMARPRGYRRADSRAESSGGNTPDPMSPVAPDCGGSPMTSPPATPQPSTADSDCSSRRRTISSRCVSPVEIVHDEVVPYEPRTFPLTEEVYEKMVKAMPAGHPFKSNSSAHHNYARDSECESRPTTPQSDSTESADTFVEDDPNDPEWTVNEPASERVPFKR